MKTKKGRSSPQTRKMIYAALYLGIALVLPFVTGQIPEIGKMLGIGPDCVKAHLKIIYSRLGVASRTEAVAMALRANLLET